MYADVWSGWFFISVVFLLPRGEIKGGYMYLKWLLISGNNIVPFELKINVMEDISENIWNYMHPIIVLNYLYFHMQMYMRHYILQLLNK